MVARVAFPIAVPGLYDYMVPAELVDKVGPGVPVQVSLRSRELWGVVVEVAESSKFKKLKPVLATRFGAWTKDNSALIKLYQWMAGYYQCGLGKIFRPLVRKGTTQTGAKMVMVYRPTGALPLGLTAKQQTAAHVVAGEGRDMTRAELVSHLKLSDHMIKMLVTKGVLEGESRQVLRESVELSQQKSEYAVTLTGEQNDAVENIWDAFGKPDKPFLLYGITGSGKTHVYIELAQRALDKDKAVIILVPEISLTPQTIQRFHDALGDVIAVIHSRMSEGERRDSVEEIVSGRKKVVIGVRSAVLVPMNDVGLIVVDEEHDHSYKQGEPDPRYNARDVAVMRGAFQKAVVVLGSATPSFESFHNAQVGKYHLIKLVKRHGAAKLPVVHIVDMNEEHQNKNWTFLSRYLEQRIHDMLEEKRQIILLLNRRGFSVSLICKDCGHIYTCPNCSVTLVYHRTSAELKCHQCGYFEQAPSTCGKCNGEQIKYKGTGIQKAEEFLREQFPDARILRMDQDTTRLKGAHVSILSAFADGEADILLGTQMVAKGLNFPGVRLVGVLQADIGLHFPDFRASERTFQLLSQVAGRAGRTDDLGEVVVQTYIPKEPAIIATQTHDYEGFFKQEIEAREALNYPPYAKLIRVLVQSEAESVARKRAEQIAQAALRIGKDAISVLGPSPAVLARINRSFRYNLVIKSQSVRALQKVAGAIRAGAEKLPRGQRVILDVDPQNML